MYFNDLRAIFYFIKETFYGMIIINVAEFTCKQFILQVKNIYIFLQLQHVFYVNNIYRVIWLMGLSKSLSTKSPDLR